MVKVVRAVQQCKKCNVPFSWNNIYRSFWGWVYKPIICENCGMKHRITVSGRFIVTLLTILPMLIFVNFLSPFNNVLLTFSIGVFLAFIGSLLTPFLVRFKGA
ncbi:TIGR04104 family putative zinc finger protein [Metabacillus niabensis]|uniref:TIGR04104 family putative zinc finger protein n=1 Tax=Metabacillus niabensis TaxID=324854 RepID=UPI001CF9AF81|nr:TIGR04104 family putative zinc finger protein [Metabacillus niabensis]